MGFPRPQAPHRTGYSRILGSTLSVEDCEGLVGAYFAQSRQPGATEQLTIDGKTLGGSTRYRRDETLREGWRHLRLGHTQRMTAAINNPVLGLLLRRGVKNAPQQRSRHAARWDEALKLITSV